MSYKVKISCLASTGVNPEGLLRLRSYADEDDGVTLTYYKRNKHLLVWQYLLLKCKEDTEKLDKPVGWVTKPRHDPEEVRASRGCSGCSRNKRKDDNGSRYK